MFITQIKGTDVSIVKLSTYMIPIIFTVRFCYGSNEPRSEKTGLGGFRPGPTQTGLYNHRRRLEA